MATTPEGDTFDMAELNVTAELGQVILRTSVGGQQSVALSLGPEQAEQVASALRFHATEARAMRAGMERR